jgi:integrase
VQVRRSLSSLKNNKKQQLALKISPHDLRRTFASQKVLGPASAFSKLLDGSKTAWRSPKGTIAIWRHAIARSTSMKKFLE